MLERFAAQVLNKYIGKYVENFNPQNLSIGIVQGAVELENLQIRKDALKELDLPGVGVKWGYIGKITLRIPSYRNYSEPWLIDINKLYLIVGPCVSDEFCSPDEEADQISKKEKKNAKLAQLEERWHASQGSGKSIYSIWRSYSSSIVTNIVENLQIRLYDLHIRYEDSGTLPKSFSFGLHVSVLSTETTDETWNPVGSSKVNADKKWKKMDLKELSFYWNTKSKVFHGKSQKELISCMAQCVINYKTTENCSFILCPVNGEARLTRMCSALPLRSRNTPRFALDVNLPEISLDLTKSQYNQLLALFSEMARWDTQKQYKIGRPSCRIHDNPGVWWRWAINKHMQKIQLKRKQGSLDFTAKRAKLVVQYVRKYKNYLVTKYGSKLQTSKDTPLESSIEEMRSEMTFPELAILHEVVYNQLDMENQKNKTKRQNDANLYMESGVDRVRGRCHKPAEKSDSKKHSPKRQGWKWGGWLGKWRGNSADYEGKSSVHSDDNLENDYTSFSRERSPSPKDEMFFSPSATSVPDSLFKDLNDEEIFEMFGDELSNEDTTDTFLKRDSVLLKLNFLLESGKFRLLDRNKIGLVSLEFRNVNIKSEWRPRYRTYEIMLDLEGINLRDLNPLNAYFSNLVTPSGRVSRPKSPKNVTPPDTGQRKKPTDTWSSLFSLPTKITEESIPKENSNAEIAPVLSVTYEKLPQNRQFSNRLEVITAPLCLTFVPGLTDKLKMFFQTSDSGLSKKGVSSETLTQTAMQRYEFWLNQTRDEVRNTVQMLMEGKETPLTVNKDKWAVSLDIFAPDIIIPEDWSASSSSMLVLSLGHMTFANHKGDIFPHQRMEQRAGRLDEGRDIGSTVDAESDEDDYLTPFITPPTELQDENAQKQTESDKIVTENQANDVFIDQEMLTEKMLWDKLYERYHLTFADLQVLVVPNRQKWDAHRLGNKSPMHLVERFTVDLQAERRIVQTTDPNYPALMLTGNLPHLTVHISHKKVHTVMKCIDQLQKKYKDIPDTSNKSYSRDDISMSRVSSARLKSSKTVNVAKANSKKLACDFLVNQISIVLEEQKDNQIMSVLEVSRIQTKFTKKPYDSTVSFSIYSLLLVDVMQQLGHDYELLLASHRRVFMDVGSGNILDSGSVSPEDTSRTIPVTSNLAATPLNRVKRSVSETSKVGSQPTSNVLNTVAESLRQFAKNSDRYYTSKHNKYVPEPMKETARSDDTFQYLISLEIHSYEKSFDFSSLKTNSWTPSKHSVKSLAPYTDIKAKFSNLDVVFNSKSWVTILNFLHKLKPSNLSKKGPKALLDTNIQQESHFDDRLLKPKPALMNILELSETEEKKEDQKTWVSIEFKKLNILLMRHVARFDNTVGRKISTITMQGANVTANFTPPSNKCEESSSDLKLHISGSIARLQMQDLTSNQSSSLATGYEILSVGTFDSTASSTGNNADDTFCDEPCKAFFFDFKQSHPSPLQPSRTDANPTALNLTSSSSTPSFSSKIVTDLRPDSITSDTMLFTMDNEFSKASKPFVGLKMESIINIRLASTCYIHSPRLIAEVLAFTDEVNDLVREQMTTATRQAYKDMARSIMDKVTDYSKSVLGRTSDEITDSSLFHGISGFHVTTPTVETLFSLQVKMQSPILAFPKYPGSFELLVANLGQITIRNESCNSGGPFDKLYIDVENMNLRSERRRTEELAAKKATTQGSSPSRLVSGPSISKLKQDSIQFMSSLNEDTDKSGQILHKTFLHFSVEKQDFIPRAKSPLDNRHCCKEINQDRCSSCHSCSFYQSHVGLLSDTKMFINVYSSSGLSVTLSKQAFEQVLKTLDNLTYGDDIDVFTDYFLFTLQTEDKVTPVHHSTSAPDLYEVPHQKSPHLFNPVLHSISSSTGSIQSTPRPDKDSILFDIPDLEIPKQNSTFNLQNASLRKYTPISAEINVPCLEFQLNGDLSDGEQGIVKVSLERFKAAFTKNNRFATELDLSLGSLDIEDLLLPEDSSHRHIVVSCSKADDNLISKSVKTVYLSTSCPAFLKSDMIPTCHMSASLPSFQQDQRLTKKSKPQKQSGLLRPYESIFVTDRHKESETQSQPPTPRSAGAQQPTTGLQQEQDDTTLVKITLFLVDGNSAAYTNVYNRVNRNINIDFNSLDCKVNLQTWVVLLDFFGIGTSPKKQYQLDPKTEQAFSAYQQLDLLSFYENQPDNPINSEISFIVRSFDLTFNKQEYEILKATVTELQSKIEIRDSMLRVCGQLGDLSVSDLSPNGSFYRERFVFTGDKALDFDIKKYDEYDHSLQRDYDISVKLRMSSIRYVHTQRFQNETVAFCQHFQQLQEVLGRMRAASVGQKVNQTSQRQARVELDIQADAPIILIPESSHSQRLVVANLGHITVLNEFKNDGATGTLSYNDSKASVETSESRRNYDDYLVQIDEGDELTVSSAKGCLLDVIHVDLIDMDLFTGTFARQKSPASTSIPKHELMELVFPSYIVTCNRRPLLKEKVKLELQMERNLEKEIKHENVPDTALSARLSSVYCAIDHEQFWLIRGVLDHNIGETIPDFPQPTAFLQPSKEQTVLTGNVYTGLSMDFYLTNVSIELLRNHKSNLKETNSLGRLDFVKSQLCYRAFSDNMKTTNLSCESFRAHDTRFENDKSSKPSSVFTTILGAMDSRNKSAQSVIASKLQFELFYRTGPGFIEFTILLNNMRVYLIVDWLSSMSKYLIDNPNDERTNYLRSKTAQLMARFGQVDSVNNRKLDSTGQLLPEELSKEIKLNFTNTEFVLVEDTSRLDSDGVILRSTAVLDYFPDRVMTAKSKSWTDYRKKPMMSCSLQSLEVFSCQLNKENETALSIIDPVTINFEVRPLKQNDLSKEEVLTDKLILERSLLDIQVSQLNIRVSYNDAMLFLNILHSLTKKKNSEESTKKLKPVKKPALSSTRSVYDVSELTLPLIDIGYAHSDVVEALSRNEGNVERAGSWLVENAQLLEIKSITSGSSDVVGQKTPLDVARLNLNAEVVRICLIDDCGDDCDVPLTEMAVRNVTIRQAFAGSMMHSYKDLFHGQRGSATFKLSGDYYNRMLSLWEPFLEPWRCNVLWWHTRGRTSSTVSGKWNVEIQTSDRFDVTVTSALMETVKKTTSTWRKDYEKINQSKKTSLARKRLPLVAYVIRNLTGSPLRFATQTTTLRVGNLVTAGSRPKPKQVTTWNDVYPGADFSFNFATMHEKQRHKRTDSLKLHQIIVQVDGWKVFQPVTVSKVGVYFRHAFKQINKSSSVYEPSVPVRVVFSVSLQGSAQKVVTVHSALAVRSRVKIPIQIQLSLDNSTCTMPILDPEETQYIPLSLTSYPIKIRPCISSQTIPNSYNYSDPSIHWQSVASDKKDESELIECSSTVSDQPKFYFAVCIQRQPYPSYEEVFDMLTNQGEDNGSSDWEGCFPPLPGHSITILPPVVISNLLPCDLRYYIRNKNVEGTLKPGIDATPHSVHVSPTSQSSLIIGCLIDGFQNCRELVVPAVTKNFQMRMLLKDWNDQTLILNVRVLWRLGCSVKVSVTAGYWIINKTGLPIVVKQEGVQSLSAGQYESHEEARSLQPLLFSYANREAPYLCTMRLGRKARFDDLSYVGAVGGKQLAGIPSFCERFSTDGGSCTRNLKLITQDGTPNREFYIGVSVRRGWGRYLHTHIVTIAPRFLLINQTQHHRLSFAQRHAISYSADSSGINYHLTIIPGSSCVFHWPRVDLDTLLCVRLADNPSCHWSGGFFINRTDAFHIALRVASPSASSGLVHPLAPHCVFLTVEVTLVNATYCVLVGDADPSHVPPPFRIDNASFAPITFKQVGVDTSYNTEVGAGFQLAYACDEPSLPPILNCSVRGDSSKVELDMTVIGEEKQLYYKNYFYITLGSGKQATTRDPWNQSVLVLEVRKNLNFYGILLQPLRSGKRSQLWRMTSDGRIFHEGSSPPENEFLTLYDSSSSARTPGLVLDIAEMAVNVGRTFDHGIPLTLKPFDERRRSTQTWIFDGDCRLKCRLKNLSVQVSNLSAGQIVVLASYDEQRVCLPTEICSLQKLIPGSGVLSVKVVRDGPTRVLRVVDIRQKRAGISRSDVWTVLESSHSSLYQSTHSEFSLPLISNSANISLSVNMQLGVGISLISNTPEELLYLTINGITMNVGIDEAEQVLSLTMQKLQIDNQLLDGYPPVILHPQITSSNPSRAKNLLSEPLVSIRAMRQPTSSRIYEIYKSLSINVGRLAISLEEKLMLKLIHFLGLSPTVSSRESELLDETTLDSAISFTNMVQTNRYSMKRFYFGSLRLSVAPMRLSVLTASRLTTELKAVKQALAFPLIQFERAPVALQDYAKHHLFETMSFVLADLSKHVREQLKSQAAIILGSIDFLGNPIGLLSDVKAGIHAGLGEGNVQNMTKHFTHGLSNTTAKFTGALSDKIGGLAMDEEYEDRRKAIQANARSSASGHVVAGLQGLMAGVVGGLTSVVTQPVKGAQNDGASGFFKGVLKGVVGTVAKPVTGVLDLASESASAVRQMSVTPNQLATRARPIRCCHSFQGCLQYYSKKQADGQTFLYAINANDYSEHFYSCDNLNFSTGDNVLVLITNKKVYFVKNDEPDAEHIMLAVDYSDLIRVTVIDSGKEVSSNSTQPDFGSKYFLELVMKSTSPPGGFGYSYQSTSNARYYLKRPRVACHSLNVAERVAQQIRYAKNLASEQTETMQFDPNENLADDRAFDLEV